MADEFKVPSKWINKQKYGDHRKALKFLTDKKVSHIKSGSTCIVTTYDNNHVAKLCTKRIDYFKNFKGATTKSFQSVIRDKFGGLLLPIEEIVYEDSHYFIYTQKKVPILNLHHLTSAQVVQVLDTMTAMFQQQIITPDMIASNFGHVDDRIVLIDFHDFRPLETYLRENTWFKMAHCLMQYIVYLKMATIDSKEVRNWENPDVIVQKKYGSGCFPSFMALLARALHSNNTDHIVEAIHNAREVLANMKK